MTNGGNFGDGQGGDWNDEGDSTPQHDPHDGVEGFEAPARPEDTSHPLADNKFDIGAFIDILKLTGERLIGSPVLIALIGLAVISLAWALFAGTLQMGAELVMGDAGAGIVGLALAFVGLILFPILFVVAVAQTALYRPGSQLLFEGSVPTDSPVDVLKSVTGLLVPVGLSMIAVGLTVMVGLVMCILPGVAAAVLFSQVPYLVAVRDEGVIDAFKRSMERTLEHWHIVAMVIGINFIAFFAISTITFCGGTITGFMGPLSYLFSPVFSWLGTTLTVVVAFVVTIAGFGTIDELEGLDIMAR